MQDPFLKTINAAVNTHDFSFGITLLVGGGMVTGTLISSKSFFDGFADSISQAWPGGPNEDVRRGFAQWGQPETANIHEDFLHLKDARYVSGNDIVPPNGNGVLWRGDIDSVSGFSLGSYNPA